MPKYTLTFLAALSMGMLAGCANDLDDNGAVRQEGDINTRGEVIHQRAQSPVLGETTGDGQPRDMRTGGGVSGNDLPASESLENRRRVNQADPTNTGPIRTDEPLREPVRDAD